MGSKPTPRTISFTVPTVPRPQFNRPSGTRVRSGLLAVAFMLTAVVAGYGGAVLQSRNDDLGLGSTSLSGQKIVTGESKLISQIARNLSPSVVSVTVNVTTTTDTFGSIFGYGEPAEQQAQAAGTGVIISSRGIIITNRHVVPSGTTKVSVTLNDGTELKDVSVLGRTGENDPLDIAFLKVNDAKGKKLQAATIGDSSDIEVGDNVIAIGNALGQFQNSVTSGIVSGYGRSIEASDGPGSGSETLADLIQTDAAINTGNSGGPLVNLNGQVIGINTAIAGGSAQNIGFAIPVNGIKGLIKQVLTTGKFERAYLGVRYVMLTADVAYQYNLKASSGAYIAPSEGGSSILSGSPAEKAGLKEKDIITAIDGVKLDKTHSLLSLIGQHSVGDTVKLTINRDGENLTLNAKLEAAPSN